MKKMFSLFILIFVLFSFPSFAETVETIETDDLQNSEIQVDFQQLFDNSLENNDFLEYENQLIMSLQEENPLKENLAEGIFYVYFYKNLPFGEDVSETGLEENVYQIKNLVNSVYGSSNYFPVINFFKAKANNSVLKKFKIGSGILDFADYSVSTDDLKYLENSVAERKSLLDSISEIESMYRRFEKMAASNTTSDLLRFSDEAYIKTSEKPNLVFVMKNEPDYKLLYDSYLEAGKNIQGISFGKTQDAYYQLIPMLEKLDVIANEYGLNLSKVLSDFSASIVKIYHTSPYVLTLLDYNQLQFIIDEIDFMVNFPAYNSRILALLKK